MCLSTFQLGPALLRRRYQASSSECEEQIDFEVFDRSGQLLNEPNLDYQREFSQASLILILLKPQENQAFFDAFVINRML